MIYTYQRALEESAFSLFVNHFSSTQTFLNRIYKIVIVKLLVMCQNKKYFCN